MRTYRIDVQSGACVYFEGGYMNEMCVPGTFCALSYI
jgi:hypothetical protein